MATPLARLIIELRGDQSQNEFARSLGVDKSTLSRVIAGDRPVDIVIVRLLERFPGHANEIAKALSAPEREMVEVAS